MGVGPSAQPVDLMSIWIQHESTGNDPLKQAAILVDCLEWDDSFLAVKYGKSAVHHPTSRGGAKAAGW